ncbi:cupin domain-containing protein [Streptomyces sp. NPDC040724]|uniref:cupin domain-containing protein n=1 Tax=Streptomyces sp. NPDC040724 TaxID=3155612 RepID=UPI0033C72BF8
MTDTLGLAELIAPTSLDTFFGRHWDREVLHRGPVPGVGELISCSDIEFLVASLGHGDPDWIRLVKGGRSVEPGAFTTRDASPSLPAVLAAVREGYTLQLAKVQKRHPAAARLCRAVEHGFLQNRVPLSRHAGSHLYLTPAGSVGLRPHYDDHSVLALQVAGSKLWRIWAPELEFPVERGALRNDRLGEPHLEVRLEPGHVLYVPRGWVHEAEGQESTSIHLTVDLYPVTWLDLATRVLRDRTELREALPAGVWSPESHGALRQELADRLHRMPSVESLGATCNAFVEEFLQWITPLPSQRPGSLAGRPDVRQTSVVRVRQDALPVLLRYPGGLRMSFAGSGLEGSGVAEVVLRYLETCSSFTVAELPGCPTDETRRELVEGLVERGLLELLPEC